MYRYLRPLSRPSPTSFFLQSPHPSTLHHHHLPLVALKELDAQDDNGKVADQINTSNTNISPAVGDIHIQVLVEILTLGVLAILAPCSRVRVVEVPCGALKEGAGELDAGLTRGGFKNAELCITTADLEAVELGCDEALDDVVVPICD